MCFAYNKTATLIRSIRVVNTKSYLSAFKQLSNIVLSLISCFNIENQFKMVPTNIEEKPLRVILLIWKAFSFSLN